ncbi:MAG: hypothetical protein HKO65_10835 [Gemmatimonadetes bacterium]|nr:hypothetical protein [Gemmatimonadota bacterium]NNM05571.1 hypothetical protein [Gemmatimonadota bacterium]
MIRPRGGLKALLSVLFLSLLFFFVGGAFGKVSAQDPPAKPAAEQELVPAEEALTAALVEAEKDGRLVFLHTGADW